MRRDAILILGIAAAIAACSPASTPTAQPSPSATPAAPVISYADAFVMEPIGGRDMTMGGVVLTVENSPVRLIGASSPDFGTIELHTMRMVDGKMQMRQVDGFDLAPGEPFALKRGGDHLMMFDVGEGVTGGESVDLTFEFAAQDDQTLTLVVPATVKIVGE